MQHSPARDAAPPLLEGQGDTQREVAPGGRIDNPLEGRHIDARRVDGEGRAVAGMGDGAAITQPVAVKDQRSAGGSVLYRRGIGRQQGDRLAPGPRIPSGNGKVQHRVLLRAGVGDRRLAPRLSGGHGAHLDGGRVSVLTGRAGGTSGPGGPPRASGSSWAGGAGGSLGARGARRAGGTRRALSARGARRTGGTRRSDIKRKESKYRVYHITQKAARRITGRLLFTFVECRLIRRASTINV